jgi:uncharacterized alkaline shock family protein YloU
MTDTASSSSAPEGAGQPTGDVLTRRGGADRVPEERGRTSIANSVVQKIASTAAREVPGIYDLGTSGISRAVGAARDRVPGGGQSSARRGVTVEVGERQAAVDLDVIVEYGVAIPELAGDVRASVISAVERMAGLEVVEVNISVDDVHLPEDDDTESRVT